jgi:hypothetical protein
MRLKQDLFVYLCLACALLLSGCASSSKRIHAPVDTGYTLEIRQSFESLPNGTHLQFQQGKRVLYSELDRWQTYCRLYVYNPEHKADYTTSIHPGVLRIRAVKIDYRSSDYPMRRQFGHLFRGFRDIPDYYLYRVGMLLDSAVQPDLRSLECFRKWATPRANKYPTLAEIRAALGDLIRLQDPL